MTFGEYRLSHSKRWQKRLLSVHTALAVVTFLAELLIFKLFLASGGLECSVGKYFLVRVVLPTSVNFMTMAFTWLFFLNSSVSNKKKEMVVVLSSVVVNGMISIMHNYFRILLVTFAIPFLVVSIFASRRLLRCVFFASWITLVISIFTLCFDPLSTNHFEVVMTVICTLVFYLSTYYLALQLVTAQREHLNFIYRSYKRQNELMEVMKIEPLTKLCNRISMEQRLEIIAEKALAKNSDAAVAVIDLDFFKSINDTYGHVAGDQVLCCLGGMIRKAMDGAVKNCFRFGGEEFLIVFDGWKESAVLERVESLRKEFMEHEFDFAPGKNFTLSAGIAFFRDGMTIKEWFNKADAMMYKAKSQGRNLVVMEEND